MESLGSGTCGNKEIWDVGCLAEKLLKSGRFWEILFFSVTMAYLGGTLINNTSCF
jgi:hypothetical protein